MSVAGVVPAVPAAVWAGRRMAESFMRDTVLVRRKTGTTTDPVTFEVVPVFDGIYHGRAKLQNWNGDEQTSESAGASATSLPSEVHFPVGAVDVLPGDIVTVVRAAHPLIVGRSARVVGRIPLKSMSTADRVHVDENVGEEVPPVPGY